MTQVQSPLRAPEKFFIGGQWVAPSSDAKIDVISPVTEEIIMSYPEAQPADMDKAIAAARDAFDNGPWPQLSPKERAGYLRKVADHIEARLGEIAEVWTAQMGAPIFLTRILAPQNPQLFRYYADLIDSNSYSFADERVNSKGGRTVVHKEPLGVCAAITPWNAPMVLLTYKIAAGLAAGCTFVVKPSPETPLEAYIMAEAIDAAGLPAGVFNLVPAGRESGDYLIRHADVDKIAFTGSTAAGKHIAGVAAERLARVSLELGGKSAAVMLPDADFAQALPTLMTYCMPIAGQVCFSLTRILVPEERAQEFTDFFTSAVKTIKMGDPADPDTRMGPLAKAPQYDRVMGYIEKGKAEGANLVLGGGRPEGFDKGYYVEPTIFTGVTPDMTIAKEEVFGPVLAIMTYKDEDDAVRIANATDYGLNAVVFGKEVDSAYAMAKRLKSGTVTINGNIIDPTVPFGGVKQSGYGREGGIEGLDNYLETKTVNFA